MSENVYYFERFALPWMISSTLKDLYYVKLFVLHWKIGTTLKDVYDVGSLVLRWMTRHDNKDATRNLLGQVSSSVQRVTTVFSTKSIQGRRHESEGVLLVINEESSMLGPDLDN